VIQVHHLNNSRSQRVLWLLEELELPYEIVKYERDPRTQLAPKALEAIHPLGKSPVVTDGDATLAESGAILEYLVDTYGKGRLAPRPGTPAHRDYRYFMHYAEGSLMPFLLLKLIFNRVRKAPILVRPVAKMIAGRVCGQFVDPNLRRHLAFIDAHLATHTWFAGDELSAADIQMSFPLEAAVARGSELGDTTRIAALVATYQARPAYQRALERGGAYSLVD
jgi:glutathione S-transferase